MSNYLRLLFLPLLAGALLSGCSLLRSEYRQPEAAIPEQWQGAVVTGSAIAAGDQWWEAFNDPQLNELIDRVLKTNNDLAAATIKVSRARLTAGLTATNLLPSVNVSGTGTLNRDLRQGTESRTYGVSGSLSYELDLWGKLAASRDADQWEAEATDMDRRNTALSLIGTTASTYWQLAYLNQRIAASEADIGYAEKVLELATAKYQAGAVPGMDLLQARQNVAGQKATRTQLVQQHTEARNALAILFDQAPQNSVEERQQLFDGPLPEVPAGLPASLLARRPDLQAAELRLRESLAGVDVARTSFYPTFTLTGSFGGTSTSLVNVLQNPVAALGTGVTLPFIQWNTARLTVKVAETKYEEAVVLFRQKLYTALAEVENALSARMQYDAEGEHLEQALNLARQVETLAEARYRSGATGIEAWLDEQEKRRAAETKLAENRLNRLKNLVKLYQTLGGDVKTQ